MASTFQRAAARLQTRKPREMRTQKLLSVELILTHSLYEWIQQGWAVCATHGKICCRVSATKMKNEIFESERKKLRGVSKSPQAKHIRS